MIWLGDGKWFVWWHRLRGFDDGGFVVQLRIECSEISLDHWIYARGFLLSGVVFGVWYAGLERLGLETWR